SSLPPVWFGLRISHAEASPAASRAEAAATTMINVRLRGRRKLEQCARGLGYALLATVAVAPAALAAGPVTTDEPGSIVAAFSERSYAPGQGAQFLLWTPVAGLEGQFFRAGPE